MKYVWSGLILMGMCVCFGWLNFHNYACRYEINVSFDNDQKYKALSDALLTLKCRVWGLVETLCHKNEWNKQISITLIFVQSLVLICQYFVLVNVGN